jgi:DNA polymerase III sliding clamp (beta) subunit (PCNA family)
MTDIIEHDITEDMVTVPGFTVDGATLRDLLVGGLVAAGKDSSLPTLTAVRLEWDTTELRVASTDRYRLVVGIVGPEFMSDVTGDGVAMIPRKDAAELVKMLPKKTNAERVSITVLGDSVMVGNGSWSRTVRMIDGDFPRYRSLIPGEDKHAATVSICFNPVFMADAAKIPYDRNVPIRWMFTGDNRPALGKYAQTDTGIDWMYLLMPVRLTG